MIKIMLVVLLFAFTAAAQMWPSPGPGHADYGGGGGGGPSFTTGEFELAETTDCTAVVNYPTNSATGDWIIVFAYMDNTTPETAVAENGGGPSWTLLEAFGGSGKAISLFERELDGTENLGTTIDVSCDGSYDGALLAIRVADATTSVASSQVSGSVASTDPMDPPAVTTTQADSVVLTGCVVDGGSGNIWTAPPSGYTDVHAPNDTSGLGYSTAYLNATSSGTQDPGSVTVTGASDWACATGGWE